MLAYKQRNFAQLLIVFLCLSQRSIAGWYDINLLNTNTQDRDRLDFIPTRCHTHNLFNIPDWKSQLVRVRNKRTAEPILREKAISLFLQYLNTNCRICNLPSTIKILDQVNVTPSLLTFLCENFVRIQSFLERENFKMLTGDKLVFLSFLVLKRLDFEYFVYII